MLNRLIAISKELERVYTEFEENSKCKAQAVEATTLELATNKEALQATAREKAAIERQKDEILAEIAKLNDVLQGVKQKMEQVSEVWSTQNLEVQRLDRELNDVPAEASQKAAEDLREKTADLGEEAQRIFADLKNVNTNSG
jgi:chromosome segregation ATPase